MKLHKTQQTILNYLESRGLKLADYQDFCDRLNLRYLSLVSFRKFKANQEAK